VKRKTNQVWCDWQSLVPDPHQGKLAEGLRSDLRWTGDHCLLVNGVLAPQRGEKHQKRVHQVGPDRPENKVIIMNNDDIYNRLSSK
jgi:hypothetical protein